MRDQEAPDLLCFVGREVVHNDVRLASAGLRVDDRLQKADELGAGVPRSGPPDDLARVRIERRIQR
jgi:hypothetical protein